MRKRLPTLLLLGVFLIGLSLLLYPTVSNAVNSMHQTQAIESYDESMTQLSQEDFSTYRIAAQTYNTSLVESAPQYTLTEAQQAQYNSLLNPNGTGVMGYIEIPKIQVQLTIYHGVEEEELQAGVGHLPGSSLPVGGESTHCVLSGHRGLPSARLFTDIDQMNEGDVFYLHVLDEVLAYQVDQIRIVLPEEVDDLAIAPGQDLCTLVTCTPYGVNTHRLLVRGHRVDTQEIRDKLARVSADAVEVSRAVLLPAMAAPILVVLLMVMLLSTRRKSAKSAPKGAAAVGKNTPQNPKNSENPEKKPFVFSAARRPTNKRRR